MVTELDKQILSQLTAPSRAALDIYYNNGYKVHAVSYDNGAIHVRLSNKQHPDTFIVSINEYTH